MKRDLSPESIYALLRGAIVRETLRGLALRAGVSESYLRSLAQDGAPPNDAVLTALGIKKRITYRLAEIAPIEQGSA